MFPEAMAQLSDDDRYDLDSGDEGDDDLDGSSLGFDSQKGLQFGSQAEKRAHHNALERKRRDHIKDSFCSLRDTIPTLQGEKSSRAQILKKAADYIQFMRKKNSAHLQDIEDLRQQNSQLGNQIRSLDAVMPDGDEMPASLNRQSFLADLNSDQQSDSDDDSETADEVRAAVQPKRIRRS